MHIRPIRNDQDHRAALAEIDACWGAPEGTEKGDKLEVLVALKCWSHWSRATRRGGGRSKAM